MRAAISIDDELYPKARKFARSDDAPSVVTEALQAFVEREAALRLARMGGTLPDIKAPRCNRDSAK